MVSDAEHLIEYFQERLPDMIINWQESIDRGYEARTRGEPRVCRRRQRGTFFKGYDAADRDLKKLEEKVQ